MEALQMELRFDPELRGKCHAMASDLCAVDVRLRLVRGHYYCNRWGKQAHWWCVDQNGNIVDPTREQFPSLGFGRYEEYDGTIVCDQCGKRQPESESIIGGNGHYTFCSGECYGRFVGVL